MYNTPKHIKDAETVKKFTSLTEDDITKSFMTDMFGEFAGKQKYNSYDYITIPKDSYGPEGNRNKNEFVTTVGLFIFNKYFLEKDLFKVTGYINHEVNGRTIKDLNQQISYAILEDKVELEALKVYSMKMQHFMRFVSILSSNYTDKMLGVTKYLEPLKKRLIDENKEELSKGNEIVAAQIEKQLLDEAKKYLKDDPSMEIYDSDSRGSWNNNFKSMFVMKGAIMNPDPAKGFDVTTSNYIDGISRDEFAVFANSIPGGAFAKARNTQTGGYWVKLFLSAFQHVILDPPGSDCKTTRTIDVTLTDKNIDEYMYNYIVSGSKLIEITSDNKSEYIGKTVSIRFSSLCESSTGICNKCMGNLYYRTGIYNVGMTTVKMPSRILNWSLKKFHDSSISIHDIDVSKAFNL